MVTSCSMRGSTLIQALWLVTLSSTRCDVARQDAWDSSSTAFSFAQELAHGGSSIVVPGNYSVAGEYSNHGPPLQLTR
jgi:hypothetical protein